jgi:hypothetical protein
MKAMTKTIGTSAAWNAWSAPLSPPTFPPPARNACTEPSTASENGQPVDRQFGHAATSAETNVST